MQPIEIEPPLEIVAPRRRWLWWLSGIILGTFAVLGGGAWWAYEALCSVPEFYADALEQDPEKAKVASKDMVRRTALLASDIQQRGGWQAMFTAEQINGWLANDLPQVYPQMSSATLTEPRVAINDGVAQIGGTYRDGNIETVFSLELEAYMREPNVVALRILHARAGAMPFSIAPALSAIQQSVIDAGFGFESHRSDGGQLLLIKIPPRTENKNPPVLESLELRDGRLFLGGHSGPTRTVKSHGRLKLPSMQPVPKHEIDLESRREMKPVLNIPVPPKSERSKFDELKPASTTTREAINDQPAAVVPSPAK